MKFLLLALLVLALFLGAKCVAVRRDLTAERQVIDADWSQVDSALQRRTAIVPDFTAYVGPRVPKAASLLAAVSDARNVFLAARDRQGEVRANARLEQSLSRLILQAEAIDPRIESEKQYSDLLESLKSAEYQIAVARRKYNEAVEHYNARIEMFPDNIVSSVTRLGKIDAYFRTPAL